MESALDARENRVWGLEHPLVYTTGLKTEKGHILDPSIELVPARRGGSVTLHNPGQLVVYFSLPLSKITGGLEQFVRLLEATLAETLLSFSISCNLSPGASGIFTQQGKVAFIGLGLKKNFIYHGISLNVANNLADFRAINSCGLTLPMTRMADLSGTVPTTLEVFEKFMLFFRERFAEVEPQEFRRRVETRYDLTDADLGFKLGWLYFHERRYWEAHEIWEMFWHEMPPGDMRIFFHAMIQVAMAWYKIFTVPNLTGAESLLGKALEKLSVVSDVTLLANQVQFLKFLHYALRKLQERDGDQSDLTPPIFAFA